MLTSIMKNANYQPAWVELRKEIAADIKRLLDLQEPNAIPEAEVEAINQKIMKYNRIVPNPQLQKDSCPGSICRQPTISGSREYFHVLPVAPSRGTGERDLEAIRFRVSFE